MEDHIGAMPYLFKEMQFPIYGSPLPLEMIGSKFDELKYRDWETDRKSTRLNSSHRSLSRMPSSA